jgi:hypothetical protein
MLQSALFLFQKMIDLRDQFHKFCESCSTEVSSQSSFQRGWSFIAKFISRSLRAVDGDGEHENLCQLCAKMCAEITARKRQGLESSERFELAFSRRECVTVVIAAHFTE